jgi:hypothetical protein
MNSTTGNVSPSTRQPCQKEEKGEVRGGGEGAAEDGRKQRECYTISPSLIRVLVSEVMNIQPHVWAAGRTPGNAWAYFSSGACSVLRWREPSAMHSETKRTEIICEAMVDDLSQKTRGRNAAAVRAGLGCCAGGNHQRCTQKPSGQ